MLDRDRTKNTEKEKPLKDSIELHLTPEQQEILNLEFLLGQKELRIKELEEQRDKLADERYEIEFDTFLYNLKKQALKPTEKIPEPIDEDISFFRRIGEFALFVYAFYTLATSFLERPEKRRKY